MQAEELEALIPELFAPWVQQLPIAIVSLDDTSVRFEIAASPELARGGGAGGGVVCGQALSAAADTLSVSAMHGWDSSLTRLVSCPTTASATVFTTRWAIAARVCRCRVFVVCMWHGRSSVRMPRKPLQKMPLSSASTIAASPGSWHPPLRGTAFAIPIGPEAAYRT